MVHIKKKKTTKKDDKAALGAAAGVGPRPKDGDIKRKVQWGWGERQWRVTHKHGLSGRSDQAGVTLSAEWSWLSPQACSTPKGEEYYESSGSHHLNKERGYPAWHIEVLNRC